jgi:iron complex outermembrane receptor protein
MGPHMSDTLKILSASALLAATPAITVAADDAEPLAEVVVTAQKREQKLLDVAASVAVLSAETVQRKGIADFEGLIEQIPGVSVTADFGGGASKVISIRGVGGTDDYRPNGSPSVGFHMDGIYQASNVFLTLPFFDVERVEVLKGPQGTLYGRNSTAGVINVITRGVGAERAGYALLEGGSYGRVRGEFAASFPVSETFGVRLAALVDRGGGYMDGKGAGPAAGQVTFPRTPPVPNPGARDGFGDRDVRAARATFELRPGADATVVVKAYASQDDGENVQADSEGTPTFGFTEPDTDPRTFYSSRYPVRDVALRGLAVRYDHRLAGDTTLTALAGYQTADRRWAGGLGVPRRISDYDFTDDVSQRSLELRVAGTAADDRVAWVLGGYAIRDRVSFVTLLDFTDQVATKVVSDYFQSRESYAAFGQLDWRFTDTLTLSAGLRYTADEGRYRGSTVDTNPYGTTLAGLAFPALPVVFNEPTDDADTSGRLTLKYQPTSSLTIYGSVGTGYKAGGFDGSTIFTLPEAKPFKPETVEAIEAGIKYSGASGLYASLDAFLYDFSELQAFTVIPPVTANVRTNVGKSEFKGLEASFGIDVLRSDSQTLRFDVSGTWLRSEIQEFEGTPAQVAANLGNDLPAAPRFSGNATLAHEWRMGNGMTLATTLDARRKSSEFKRLNNNLRSQVEGFTTVDLRVELRTPEAGWSAYVFGRNITDETYFVDRNGGARLAAAPRTYGIGARYDF